MDMPVKNKISWEIIDGIGYIKFTDTPENRMDSAFFQELQYLVSNIIPESRISCLVITGIGRHFSTGANLEDLLQMIKKEGPDALIANYQSFKFFSELSIPVIAAIKGVCIGSALELAMHCHFRLCAEDAILGLPESSFGLIPGAGGISKIIALTAKAKAIELVIKGNTFNANDALNWNVVDAVYPKKLLMDKAIELAKKTKNNYRKYNKTDYLDMISNINTN